MRLRKMNLILRRTHLYLGMLLIPWVLMYGISTFIFNHGEFFRQISRVEGPAWQRLFAEDYQIEVPPGREDLRPVAQKILEDHDIQGAFGVSRQGQRININLPDFWAPRRLSYFINQHRLVAEQKQFVWIELLARLHFRTGYGREGFLHDAWAVAVDLVCVSLLTWVATGLYLWWKIPVTRKAGWFALGSGMASFIGFLLTL